VYSLHDVFVHTGDGTEPTVNSEAIPTHVKAQAIHGVHSLQFTPARDKCTLLLSTVGGTVLLVDRLRGAWQVTATFQSQAPVPACWSPGGQHIVYVPTREVGKAWCGVAQRLTLLLLLCAGRRVERGRLSTDGHMVHYVDVKLRADGTLPRHYLPDSVPEAAMVQSVWCPADAPLLAVVYATSNRTWLAIHNNWKREDTPVCVLSDEDLELAEEDDDDDDEDSGDDRDAAVVSAATKRRCRVAQYGFAYIVEWFVACCSFPVPAEPHLVG